MRRWILLLALLVVGVGSAYGGDYWKSKGKLPEWFYGSTQAVGSVQGYFAGPVGLLQGVVTEDDKRWAHTAYERCHLMLSKLATEGDHAAYAYMLKNQERLTFFVGVLQDADKLSVFRWDGILTPAVLLRSGSAPDTIEAEIFYGMVHCKQAGRAKALVDYGCQNLRLHRTDEIVMPMKNLLSRQGGDSQFRVFFGVPRHPGGKPSGWTWTGAEVAGFAFVSRSQITTAQR